MKIGLVLDDSLDRNDGVQQYVRTLGSWLTAQGNIVHYLVGQSKGDGIRIHSLSHNINVRFNGNRLSIPLPANSGAIQQLLKRERYDVLHIQMPYNPMLAGKIIRYASPLTAVVGTFHILPLGWFQKLGSKALATIQLRQLRRFDAICSVSSVAQIFAQTHFGLKSSVIPNMIDLAAWQTDKRPHPYRVVFLGRLVPRKGCRSLLAAVAQLPEALQDKLEVLIAGDGSERSKLEQFVANKHLKNVNFLGYIEEKAKPDLLASAEIAVFPSLGGESFGIVLIEAMAAGAGAVLGGDNPGYMSVLSSLPASVINPRNAASFSVRLQNLLQDKALRFSLHQEQQKLVEQYDVNTVGKHIANMYQEAQLHRQQEMR